MSNQLELGTLYERIKSCMERHFETTLTQKAIGEHLGVSDHLVGKWKKGILQPTRSTLELISTLTNTPIQWLLFGNNYNTYGNTAFLEGHYPYTFREEIWSANGMLLDVATTGDCGGDAGHGGRTYVRLTDLGGTAMGVNVHSEGHEVAIGVMGDAELGTLAYALEKAGGFLKQHSKIQPVIDEDKSAPILPRPIYSPSASVEFPVRGAAAADDSGGTSVPDTDEIDDTIVPPPGLTFVPVKGDSMSPVLLSGQYAVIDREREGFEVDGGIVVASILEPEPGDDYREDMVGTFVKRCYKREQLYYFTSINDFSPFSAYVDHCRIWPVIGVWFGDKGKPPEGY